MLTRPYLTNLADVVSELLDSGFAVRATDAELHFAARDAAQEIIAKRPALADDRDDIETAIVAELIDTRAEFAALDADVAETVAEMAAADRAA